jgi:hypothetical protein
VHGWTTQLGVTTGLVEELMFRDDADNRWFDQLAEACPHGADRSRTADRYGFCVTSVVCGSWQIGYGHPNSSSTRWSPRWPGEFESLLPYVSSQLLADRQRTGQAVIERSGVDIGEGTPGGDGLLDDGQGHVAVAVAGKVAGEVVERDAQNRGGSCRAASDVDGFLASGDGGGVITCP